MEKLKSTVVCETLNEKRTAALTNLMRNILIPEIGKGVKPTASINELMKRLPETNKAWQYGRAKMQPYRKQIDRCVDEIIESDPKIRKSFEEFRCTLTSMSEEYKQLYGDRQNQKIKSYAEKEMIDFYSRAGNTLLKELYKIRCGGKYVDAENSKPAEDRIAPRQKNRACLIKKKYEAAKQQIESDKNSDEEKRQGLELMKNISDESSYARSYLAFYYYRNRDKSLDNDRRSIEFLKRAYEEDNNMTACYLLGKQLLEKGDKIQARDYIQLSADGGNKYAQFAYAKICKSLKKEYTAAKYAMQAEQNGNVKAKAITKTRKGYPTRVRVRYSENVRRCTYHAQLISNRCAAAINRILSESDAHISRLKSEFEYEIMRSQDEYVFYEKEY